MLVTLLLRKYCIFPLYYIEDTIVGHANASITSDANALKGATIFKFEYPGQGAIFA